VRDRWLARKITDKEYKEEVEKYRKEVNGLVDSYFKVVDIKK